MIPDSERLRIELMHTLINSIWQAVEETSHTHDRRLLREHRERNMPTLNYSLLSHEQRIERQRFARDEARRSR